MSRPPAGLIRLPAGRRAAMAPSPAQVRLAVGLLLTLAAVIGAAGITEHMLFRQPTNLKYLLTVAAPLLLLAAVSVEQPLRVLMPAIVLAAPFGGFVMTFRGIHVSLLTLLLLAAVTATILSEPAARTPSWTGAAAAIAVLLLIVPISSGSGGSTAATVLATLVATGWVAARTARLEGGLRLVLGALIASAALQAVIAIWEFRTGLRLNLYSSAGSQAFGSDYYFQFGGKNRPTGSFYDPISLGNVLALSCPVALALALASPRAAIRIVAAGAALITGIALALTLSRMSWIGAVVGLVVALLLMPGRGRRAAIVPALGAVALIVVIALGSGHSALTTRFASIFDPTAQTVSTAQGDRERVMDWQVALSTGAAHPIFGVGFGDLLPYLENRVPQTTATSHAQSTYLQLFAEAGAAGAIALLLVLGGLARDLAAGLRRERLLAAGMAGGLAALLITWLTDYTIRYVPVAAIFAVLFGAIAARARRPAAAASVAPSVAQAMSSPAPVMPPAAPPITTTAALLERPPPRTSAPAPKPPRSLERAPVAVARGPIVVAHPHSGGPAATARRAALELQRRGWRVQQIALREESPLPIATALAAVRANGRALRGAELLHVELGGLDVATFWFALLTARLVRAAVVVAHDAPTVTLAPGTGLIGWGTRWRDIIGHRLAAPLLDRRLRRLLAGRTTVGVVLSEEARQRWLEARPGRVLAIDHGADPPSPNRLRPAAGRYVLYAGYLGPSKGLDVLLDAWQRVGPSSPLPLLIAGTHTGGHDGERYVQRMRRRAERLDRPPTWLGWVPEQNLARLFADAAIVVIPYRRSNPASGIVVRAMVEGRAIVASRVPAALDALTDGVDALLVRPGASDELATALGRLLADSRLRDLLGDAAAQAAAQRFTWRRHLDGLEAAYALARSTK